MNDKIRCAEGREESVLPGQRDRTDLVLIQVGGQFKDAIVDRAKQADRRSRALIARFAPPFKVTAFVA